MRADGERMISRHYIDDDYLRLNFTVQSTEEVWSEVINMFDDRIRGRFLEPIGRIINADEDGLFTATAIICLLVETFYQFRYGLNETPSGANATDYKAFLTESMPSLFDECTAKIFYRDIRCGILHSGQTRGHSTLTRDYCSGISLERNSIHVNVGDLYETISQYFENYLNALRRPENIEIRGGFVQKMDYICCRDKETQEWQRILPNIRRYAESAFRTITGRRFTYSIDNNRKIRIDNPYTSIQW